MMMAPLPDWQPGSTQATKLSEALAIVMSQRHLRITAVAAKAGSTGDGEEQKQEAPAEPGTSDDVASQRPVSPPPPDFPTLQVASRRPQTQSDLMLKGVMSSAPVSLFTGAMRSFPGVTFCFCFLLCRQDFGELLRTHGATASGSRTCTLAPNLLALPGSRGLVVASGGGPPLIMVVNPIRFCECCCRFCIASLGPGAETWFGVVMHANGLL